MRNQQQGEPCGGGTAAPGREIAPATALRSLKPKGWRGEKKVKHVLYVTVNKVDAQTHVQRDVIAQLQTLKHYAYVYPNE